MINLLPPETKVDYTYARRNRTLLRWVTSAALCLVGSGLLLGVGYLYLNQSISTTTKQIADGKSQLETQNLKTVQTQVTDISNNLKLVVQVLSKEILFSKMLKQLATVTPDNVVLSKLEIIQAQGGVDITALASNYNAATQLQLNLSDPKNQIFTKADIVSITCLNSNVAGYPCTANIRALFATDNPFLFINDKGTKS